MKTAEKSGVAFNIQRFTVHDGPGIRTEVFLKGCPLRCRWCSNPESFEQRQQVGVYKSKCIGTDRCGACVKVCPQGALLAGGGKIAAINRERCVNCLRCQEQCPSDALKLWGSLMTVDEVMAVVERDRSYYARSGGGVTLSGGESLLQWQFASAILQRCRKAGIHTCVESALYVSPEILEKILSETDLLITDIKQMDDDMHRLYTGVSNQKILDNIEWASRSGVPMILRLPIIPEVNDTVEHVDQAGRFIVEQLGNRVIQVQLLRFRRLGEEKYESLGLPYPMEEVNPEREESETHIRELVEVLRGRGIPAYAGTTNRLAGLE